MDRWTGRWADRLTDKNYFIGQHLTNVEYPKGPSMSVPHKISGYNLQRNSLENTF